MTSSTTFCDLKTESTVFELREDGSWTYCKYHDAQGMERKIRARFSAGADGKTGFTRKIYLGLKGVHMKKVTEDSYEETWVALNWHITFPTPESHPQFPGRGIYTSAPPKYERVQYIKFELEATSPAPMKVPDCHVYATNIHSPYLDTDPQ